MNPMSIMAQAEKLGIPELQRSIQNGVVPAFIGVPLLQEKVKRQRQMQMGMAAQQPKRPSVAEQVGQEAQQVSVEDMMRERARMMQGEMGQTGGISDFLPKSESFSAGGAVARVLKSVGGAVDVMALPTLIDTLTAENPDDIATANKRRAEDKKSKDSDEPDGYVGADIKNHAKGGIIAFKELGYVDPAFIEPEEAKRLIAEQYTYNPEEAWYNAPKQWIENALSTKTRGMRPPNEQGKLTPKAIDVATPQTTQVIPQTAVLQKQPEVTNRVVPVTGNVAPAVQTPYAQAVQAAPSQPAVEPQTTAEPIMSAVERAKLFKEALGEDVGRADTMKRLAEREAATAKQEERAPWLALMQAGLATMAGTSPFAMANIGAGGVAGLNAYMKAQDKLDTAKENHDAILAQLNKAQRAEDIAAYKFGADSEQADKALAAREKLQDKELASREKMNREDNAVRREGYAVNREIAGMRMSNTGVSGDLKPYQADQLRKSAVSAAERVLSNMLSPEYKEFSALKTKAEQKQYKQNLVDSYFAAFTGTVPSAPAAAQAPYDLNWVP